MEANFSGIYTIGYGNRTIEDFITLLHQFDIEYLVDVRSQPYSKFNKMFCKETLERKLTQENIEYLFLGDCLGGRPTDPSCFTEGRADYDKIRKKEFFRKGFERLITSWEKKLLTVVMCAELKPEQCHRSQLIGMALVEKDVPVKHINQAGRLVTQKDLYKGQQLELL